tara:strand:- start:1147 stop:1305 length:159 start_codon:yes stop_codon:yes gene_type:complete
MTNIKKIKDKFVESLFREKPILETLLVKDRNNSLKLLLKLRKIKKNNDKVKK